MESNHFYKELGLKLKSSRKAKGLTIDAIAKHLNKTSSTISKYENGEIAISLDVLADYCIFLNIDIAMLLPNTYTRQEERSDRYKNLYHDKLWIYWYRLATKKMQTSLIECDNTNLKAYFYFNIRNRNDYHDCAYIYHGDIYYSDYNIDFFFQNIRSPHDVATLSVPNMADNTNYRIGLFTCVNFYYQNVAHKVLVNKDPITDKNLLLEVLIPSAEEIKYLRNTNLFMPRSSGMDIK